MGSPPWVTVILSQSVGNEVQGHEKPSFSVFPAASTCAVQCFSLRTKAPLPASRVSVVVQRPWLIERYISRSMACSCLESVQSERTSILKHSDEVVPTMVHSALWRGLSTSFRLWVAKQAQVILLRQPAYSGSRGVSRGLSFYPRPCISPSAWKPSQLENWHPRFLQLSALPYCKEVGAGDFKVFDGPKVLWL